MFTKSSVTNLIALFVWIAGYFIPEYGPLVVSTGAFALSGALTNWIAIHMLFEKVPGFYGSGVVQLRFEEFKAGIKDLIVREFFSRAHIERFLASVEAQQGGNALMDRIDFERIFEHLIDAITESPLGGMLNMMGGRKALEPLKAPIIEKLRSVVTELLASRPESGGEDLASSLVVQVERIIDSRLAELTPQRVKQIVEEMIRHHLGWLVIWGGVFGGLIGLVAAAAARFLP